MRGGRRVSFVMPYLFPFSSLSHFFLVGNWQGHLQVDDSSVGRLEMTFWKGVYLRAEREADGEAMAKVDANEKEESEMGVEAVAEKRACILRVWVEEEDGMRHLRATCSYQPASEGTTQIYSSDIFLLLFYSHLFH